VYIYTDELNRKASSLNYLTTTVKMLQLHDVEWCCDRKRQACNTSTTQTQPRQISNTQRTENKMTDVVIQQHSRNSLMMDILTSETF